MQSKLQQAGVKNEGWEAESLGYKDLQMSFWRKRHYAIWQHQLK